MEVYRDGAHHSADATHGQGPTFLAWEAHPPQSEISADLVADINPAETFDFAPALCYTETMLLQTLVQLNILILAAPALAGWTLLPTAHPGLARAACVALHGRAVQAAAPLAVGVTQAAQTRSVARPRPLVSPSSPATAPAASSSAVTSCAPFPHAARAP